MNILDKICRHAAVASGNFATIFKHTGDIADLPAATARLLLEINSPEPSVDRLEQIFLSAPGLSSRVLRMVNSSLFGLSIKVADVRYAVNLLGLTRIREIALTYIVTDALPAVESDIFNRRAMWTDSLVMAILARSFARRFRRGSGDEAFTSAMLSHIALPVLLTSWREYYLPVIEEWQSSSDRLSEIERRSFGWDHSQAGAWIAKTWNFPENLVCYIGAHNLSPDEIVRHGLQETIAIPLSLAAMLPSVIKPEIEKTVSMVELSVRFLNLGGSDFKDIMDELTMGFEEVRNLFDLTDMNIKSVIDEFDHAVQEAKL